ncbi:MAG: hypothetical protein BGO43_09235 [Gammaproteobacteria bacterium 39-13]|nr:PilZ domain-containing protein [Gammaproteobacteria bacterium]OJV93825.1 MAG: hypothetical protein BGO43_09235 [Gammaproteobacteria bacterium 39-13]
MEQQQERRRYFRIDDEVILAWRELTSEEKNRRLQQFMLGEIEYPDIGRLYLSLESDINSLVQELMPRESRAARAVQLLNRKINLIARGGPLNATQRTLLDEAPQPVNISACGVAFMVEHAIEESTDLQIEMILVPEKTYILCYGVVVGCDKVAKTQTKPYRVNIDFVAMREDDRDRLIQHIMQKEMEMLKLRRQKGTR